jgi:hypothetical protein
LRVNRKQFAIALLLNLPAPVIINTNGPRGIKVTAGSHIPRLTVTARNVPPPPAPDGVSVQVLVTTGQEAVHGYDSVISDPARSRAKRYGIKRGARVVNRPDGYIGVISDIHTLPRYFAQLTA